MLLFFRSHLEENILRLYDSLTGSNGWKFGTIKPNRYIGGRGVEQRQSWFYIKPAKFFGANPGRTSTKVLLLKKVEKFKIPFEWPKKVILTKIGQNWQNIRVGWTFWLKIFWNLCGNIFYRKWMIWEGFKPILLFWKWVIFSNKILKNFNEVVGKRILQALQLVSILVLGWSKNVYLYQAERTMRHYKKRSIYSTSWNNVVFTKKKYYLKIHHHLLQWKKLPF